jgi:hypothetical protein
MRWVLFELLLIRRWFDLIKYGRRRILLEKEE